MTNPAFFRLKKLGHYSETIKKKLFLPPQTETVL